MIVYLKPFISDTGGVYRGKILQGQLSARSITAARGKKTCLKAIAHRLAQTFCSFPLLKTIPKQCQGACVVSNNIII